MSYLNVKIIHAQRAPAIRNDDGDMVRPSQMSPAQRLAIAMIDSGRFTISVDVTGRCTAHPMNEGDSQ